MSEIKVNNIQSLSGANGPEISGTVEMNSTGAMALPRGNTAYRGGRGRGLFGGGRVNGSLLNTIDYITISTLGDALDFGDLTVGRRRVASAASSTRGVWAGGYSPDKDEIDYVQIMSTGNAVDFGDLANTDRNYLSGASNGHGGLG